MELKTFAADANKKIEEASGSLKDFRLTHLALFNKTGFASKNHEDYKFSNLPRFMEEYAPVKKESLALEIQDYLSPQLPTLIFLDGEYMDTRTSVAGLTIKNLGQHFDSIKTLFAKTDAGSNFHHSLMSEGVILEVAQNTKIEKPIRVVYLNTRSATFAPTIILKVGLHSEVTLLEESIALDSEFAFFTETYIEAARGSKVEHIQLDRGMDKTIAHGTTHTKIDKDASYKNVLFIIGGKFNRRNLTMNLEASGANAETYALYMTEGKEHTDISTMINHHAADTTSNQVAKGIADGESKAIFTGRIHIFKDAQRVAAGQLNKNLLLSKKAQIHSQPQLEIFADDVKCSHGSTTGQLSDEEVFYFQTRGIPQERAKSLLAYGFGLDVVMQITNPEARAIAEVVVKEKLKTKFQLGGEL